jgi:hypothetical protein
VNRSKFKDRRHHMSDVGKSAIARRFVEKKLHGRELLGERVVCINGGPG